MQTALPRRRYPDTLKLAAIVAYSIGVTGREVERRFGISSTYVCELWRDRGALVALAAQAIAPVRSRGV